MLLCAHYALDFTSAATRQRLVKDKFIEYRGTSVNIFQGVGNHVNADKLQEIKALRNINKIVSFHWFPRCCRLSFLSIFFLLLFNAL